MDRHIKNAVRQFWQGALLRWLFPAVAGLSVAVGTAHGFISTDGTLGGTGSYTPETYYKSGAVYARSIVPGENGQPQFVIYDKNGTELEFIGEKFGKLADARVVSGDYYRSWMERFETLQQTYPELVTRSYDDYQAQNTQFTTIDGQAIIKPQLDEETLIVALRPIDQRYEPDGSDLILAEFPIDITATKPPFEPGFRSLLLSPEGTILRQTIHNIGYRVAYYGTGDDYDGSGSRNVNDTIYGPMEGVKVELAMDTPGGRAVTDSSGRYAMQYQLPSCPGFTYMYSADVLVMLQYRRFNPDASPTLPYVMRHEESDYCNGLGIYSAGASEIIATSALPPKVYYDFPVDLMVVSGKARIANPDPDGAGEADGSIPIGEQTLYDSIRVTLQRVAHDHYDFDGDGQFDTAVLGRLATDTEGNEIFLQIAEGEVPELQGVWLSTHEAVIFESSQASRLPDLTRQPDWSSDFDDRALLSQLSLEDFQNTDLYVFRESNGKLLMERKGLRESEVARQTIGVDGEQEVFYYTLRLYGADSRPLGSDEGFAVFQQAEGIVDKSLHRREADHLRPGEAVRVVAINRPSGYIGSVTATLTSANGSGETGPSAGGDVAFAMSELELGPPNLKIWAERRSQVEHGLTKSETREQRIGAEGAGLTSDTLIDIYTEWFDAEGRPLPEALGDYGYTARLAKVVAPNQLEAVTGEDVSHLSEFKVRPGRQLQVIRLPEENVGNQHLYVQVSGEYDKPDFSSQGLAEGILVYRPDRFVPVKVPVFDEETTNLQLSAYRKAREANLEAQLTKPEPFYQWAYRPEFQFTIYDLEVQAVRRQALEGQDSEDILEVETPFIASDDALVELYYDLYAPSADEKRLDALQSYGFDGGQELIFTLGEQELTASYGPDGKLQFDNLEHLASISAEDSLTLRLYANNDTANVLWEFAFLSLAVAVDLNRDGKLTFDTEQRSVADITSAPADDPVLPTDRTLPDLPFRFWVNNDFDVVNVWGETRLDLTHCTDENPVFDPDSEPGYVYQQICEQWDQDPSHATDYIGSEADLKRIETYRDLEDFVPLAIRLGSQEIGPSYHLVLKASHVNLNIFKGHWRDDGENVAHAYITNPEETALQVQTANKDDGHIGTLYSGDSIRLTAEEVNNLLDRDGVARFIFEGIAPNDASCADEPTRCYLSVAFYKQGDSEPLSERRLYLELRDVKDFYEHITAGTAQIDVATEVGEAFDAVYHGPDAFQVVHTIKVPIYEGLVSPSRLSEHYTFYAHGWRMVDAEKIGFGDTGFKRLYWSGYMGQYGFLSWPTGWFPLPAHEYVLKVLRVLPYTENYNNSEAVARRVGKALSLWLERYSEGPGYFGRANKRYVAAHSMGNVVISEMLRHAKIKLFNAYAPSESATVAGAYDPAVGEIEHKLQWPAVKPTASCWAGGLFWPEDAWRCYNLDHGSDWDMPPDLFRINFAVSDENGELVIRHGKTTDDAMAALASVEGYSGSYYNEVISNLVEGRIVNMFSGGDAALNAWEFNQLTKPDSAGWSYHNEMTSAYQDYELCKALSESLDDCEVPTPLDTVNAKFWDPSNSELNWSDGITEGSANILAHIVPARTKALGQVKVDAEGFLNFDIGFTNSNQDHSAQFHGYYAEKSVKNTGVPTRARYWNIFLNQAARLRPTDFSNLENGLGLETLETGG